jgi:ketosteroid isomerase-like protein
MDKIVSLFCACIIFIGCTGTPKVNISSEANLIRNLEGQVVVAFQNKEIEKTVSLFSSEGIFMEPYADYWIGPQNIRKRIESMFADTTVMWNTFSIKIENIEVSASGDLACVRGIYSLNRKAPNGIVESPGKWVDIWKKSDGQWKGFLDIMMP